MPTPTIDELTLADEPAHWSALGFDVHDDRCQIGEVRLRFAGVARSSRPPGIARPPEVVHPPGIAGWSLRGIASDELDGLPTTISARPVPARAPMHPNGIVAIDHVVAISPAFERSVTALQAVGLDLRRVREEPTPAGAPRQAFFRLGHEILELVAEPAEVIERAGGANRPAHFWGLAFLSEDLDRTVELLAPHVSEARPAVQAGRRIATVRRSAGLSVPLALMSTDERVGQRAGRQGSEAA